MKEKKGLGEIGRREERREGRERRRIVMMMMVVMMVMGCNSGGVSEGKVNLEAKNSFLESLVAIGEGFQEIFVGFGSAIGDVLGFNVVKVGDKKSKVGEHFENLGKGLQIIKDKLDGLAKEITSALYVDTNGVESVINSSSGVISKLIVSVTKLAGITKEGNDADMGDAGNIAGAVHKESLDAFIKEVKEIIETVEKSGVKINAGDAGAKVNNGNGLKIVVHNSKAGDGDANKLAAEITKSDPWAMFDKIKNAKTTGGNPTADNAEVGALALGGGSSANDAGTAKTNADLAAAVALKAMIKDGKFSPHDNDKAIVKAAAVSAVNKVLGVLDVIIRKTVANNLDKIREAVKGIKYSETSGVNSTKSDTTQATTAK
ncbi:Variable major protein (plasmid) [Borrelia crocidurae DOU]|uniref:Variable large protein n=1 Tax=Borrelia crocidurae DOU TaxID=1293575 RepID=W5SKD3_9SPIR|nr:variable large family protein [Borrelia crocidurae]AHH07123.1 Variable major protein [Borrelia crocidurae DOU]